MTERIRVPSQSAVLSDIMETLRFRSTIFMRSHLTAPWGFSLEEDPAPRFHISIDGSFFVGEERRREPLRVREMDIVILPKGRPHWIADRPGRALIPTSQLGTSCGSSPPSRPADATNLVMCGIARFETGLSHPLLGTLPSLIHLPSLDAESSIWRLVELIDAEVGRGRSLRSPILDRLTEALFLHLLHEVVDHSRETIGFVAALRDPQLRHALELLHQEPDTPWTLDELATRVALSRATLVRRFRDSVGVPPIEYLTHWRLLKAHQLARFSADSIDRIASQVGFSSAPALTRAFKRFFGITPTSLRR